MKILFLTLFYSITSTWYTTYYVYDSFSILDYLYSKKDNYNDIDLIRIRDYISATLRDAYAFTEISKNPPQPDFDKNYFQKIDIAQSLREINTTNISFYELYQKISKKISELKDYAISIKTRYYHGHDMWVNRELDLFEQLYLINPLKFNIKKTNDNKYEIFCELNKKSEIFNKYFNKTILDYIESNKEFPIIMINNQDPFDFIPNFCDNCRSTKNIHGTFSNKFNTHNHYNLLDYPLEYKDLYMNITYQNGKNVSIKFLIYCDKDFLEIKNLTLDKIEVKEENKNNNKENKKIEWEYSLYNSLKCKEDHKNKVNILNINFLPVNYLYFRQCINLFDRNNYPIILIFQKNINKLSYSETFILIQELIELISPLTSISYYFTKKVARSDLNNIKVDYGEKNQKNFLYVSYPINPTYESYQELNEIKKN